MTLKVFLADDEPLILAGIKSLVNWEEAGFELVGSARNGKQALEAMESLRPDIVIADIKMPVMDGMELLAKAAELYPEAVFIMLTNLQEFDLARQSFRSRAVDYLVKNQLEAGSLLKCLETAREESFRRQKNQRGIFEQELREINEDQLLANCLKLLLTSTDIPDVIVRAFQKTGVLAGFKLLAVKFIYPEHFPARTPSEFDELFRWERAVVDELVKNGFPRAAVTSLDSHNEQIFILVWDSESGGDIFMAFYKKLLSASSNITGIKPCLTVTETLSGKDGLREAREQISAMDNHLYLTGESFIRYGQMKREDLQTLGLSGSAGLQPLGLSGGTGLQPLGLSGIASSLKKELNAKNAAGCSALFDRAIARVSGTPHEKAQAIWLCTELYTTICSTIGVTSISSTLIDSSLTGSPDAAAREGIFFETAQVHGQIKRIATREDAVRFLTVIRNELRALLQRGTSGHEEIIDHVKRYVRENVSKRITLHETANVVCLSAGYLSSLFKKYCNENFMDFVNRCKIEKAAELLKREDYLIGQVSDMLSFENAYYFTKVFKKYMGVTPSVYRSSSTV